MCLPSLKTGAMDRLSEGAKRSNPANAAGDRADHPIAEKYLWNSAVAGTPWTHKTSGIKAKVKNSQNIAVGSLQFFK